jgi:hypothetical protein
MNALCRLAEVGGDATRTQPPERLSLADAFGAPVADQLVRGLAIKNGFYAFESALHVLSDHKLVEWNRGTLWRHEYGGMADGAVFFAEDVFGVQFCLRDEGVATFDPETGAFEAIATSLVAWALAILDDPGLWTGHRIAHAWQLANGSIPTGSRLAPVTPFVLGGEFSVDNMKVTEAVKGMRYRASIAVQLRDLPDGTPVTLRVTD